MDALTDFIIPIIGLKLGEHSYQFNVDRQFFKEFDNTDLQEGCLKVDLILKKRSNHMPGEGTTLKRIIAGPCINFVQCFSLSIT